MHEFVHAPEILVGEQRGDAYREAGGRREQALIHARSDLRGGRVAALGGHGGEGLDEADHRAEQAMSGAR